MRLQDHPTVPTPAGSEHPYSHPISPPGGIHHGPAAENWRGWHADTSTEIELAQQIEHDVFVAEGFSSPTPTHHTREFEEYGDQSRWFLAAQGAEAPSGMMRVIVPGALPLPVAKAFRDEPAVRNAIADTKPAEIGIAVHPGARGGHAARFLYQQGYLDSMAIGQRYWIAVIEAWYLGALRSLHFQLEQLTEPRWYMGGNCLAALIDLNLVIPSLTIHDPEFGAFMSGETETW